MQKIIDLYKKYPALSALLCGLLAAFSFEPTRNIVTFVAGIVGFLFCLSDADSKKEFMKRYFLFTYGYFTLSLYWIQLSFISVDMHILIPFAILTFPLILCAFYMIGGLILYAFKDNRFFYIIFALTFWVNELVTGHIFTGFPWVLSAYALNDYLMQGGAYLGTYGMSLLTLLWSASFYKSSRKRQIILMLLFVCATILGAYRLFLYPPANTTTTIRIVHPDISQRMKLNKEDVRKNLDRHIALSNLPAERKLDIIVWPECVIPYPINKVPEISELLKDAVPTDGFLVVGAPRVDDDQKIYTSAYILNDKSETVHVYDKNHLVPFGEYLPFRWLLSPLGVDKMTQGARDYSSGKDRPCYALKNIPEFIVLICYEIIFPHQVVQKKRPQWILNLTNDAWYLNSTGPYQHLHSVRWRAIEEGLPIIRCANKGVSAIIDSMGRIRSSLKIGAVGVIDDYIPIALY